MQTQEQRKTWYAKNKLRLAAKQRAYCAANREVVRERNREYSRDKRSPEQRRQYYASLPPEEKQRIYDANYSRELMRLYRLSRADYEAMVKAQEGKCRVCDKIPTKRLVVDHDHTAGKVRGLLCNHCNLALGRLGDNVEGVERALRYLRGN